MKEIKPLPKDFDNWIAETALDFSRYIYYKRRTKRLIDGYCTSCGQDMVLQITKEKIWDEMRHNEQSKCPKCGKVITYKAIGKTTLQVDEIIAAYAQKTADGFAIRYFDVVKKYKRHYRNPELCAREFARDFYIISPNFEPGHDGKYDIKSYEYTYFKQNGPLRWCHARTNRHAFKTYPACLYSRNLCHVLVNTPWKYSALHELAKNLDKFNVWGYLRVYIAHPAFEYLVKARLYRIVSEDVDNILETYSGTRLNLEAKSVAEALRISKSGLKQIQRLKGTFDHLCMIRSAEQTGVALKDRHVNQLVAIGIDGGIAGELLKYATAQKILNYIAQNLPQKSWKVLGERTRKDLTHTISVFWNDYLTNYNLLGYDMTNDFIIFPRDLKARHDEVMELYKAKEDELEDKAIKEMYITMLEKFGFAYEGLVVRPPVDAAEVIAEGHALRHCVSTGSYIKNIVKGKRYIFLIRKEGEQEDEPFFTAEVANGVVRQCRGFKNCSMTDEVKKFVIQWQKKKLATA